MSIIVWRVLARGDVLNVDEASGRDRSMPQSLQDQEICRNAAASHRREPTRCTASLWFIYEALRGFLATRCGQKSKLRPGSRR